MQSHISEAEIYGFLSPPVSNQRQRQQDKTEGELKNCCFLFTNVTKRRLESKTTQHVIFLYKHSDVFLDDFIHITHYIS